MELSFHYARDRQFYALRFTAGAYESVPFLGELRFWGADRFPCPHLSTLAALIALKDHPMTALTPGASLAPAVVSALSQHFGVEIHPETYDINRRELAGGDKLIAPSRFARANPDTLTLEAAEVLTWISLDDLAGPFGGHIRTNLDAFDLTENAKDLIVALCCGGLDVGHIAQAHPDAGLARLLHRIGLELIDLS